MPPRYLMLELDTAFLLHSLEHVFVFFLFLVAGELPVAGLALC